MTTQEAEIQGSKWISRIEKSNKTFDSWSKKFKCQQLDDYYEGFQWQGAADYEPYVTNLFYSTIQIKKPALLFERPNFKVSSKPQIEGFALEVAAQLNQFRQDTLNTIISQNVVKFAENCELAMLDSFFYFGIVEVGYCATWRENPNAERPELAEDYKENVELGGGETINKLYPLPENESIYIKRIPAHRFRTNSNANWDLEQCDWVGYYEWVRVSDLLSEDSGFEHTENITLHPTGGDEGKEYDQDEKDSTQQGDMIKIWKIWDLRARVMNIVSTVGNVIIYQQDFRRLPLFDLKFSHRRKGWYPIPLTHNWRLPQDEYNESREQLRTMRRRTKRLWQVRENYIDEQEKSKATAGPDGTIVVVKTEGALQPVLNPPIDNVTEKSLMISKDDFNVVSATTSEARGESDRTTATQASISNTRAGIRESYERGVVAKWLCRIGREVLLQIRERFTEKIWIKVNAAVGLFGQDYNDILAKWKMIDPMKELGDEGDDDILVELEVESLSPIVNEQSKKEFMEFLAVLNQYPQLSFNPVLIREAAYRIGYRNESVIKAFQEMAQLQMIGQFAQAQANLQQMGVQTGQGSNLGQRTVEQATPPTQAEIENQLANQGMPVS